MGDLAGGIDIALDQRRAGQCGQGLRAAGRRRRKFGQQLPRVGEAMLDGQRLRQTEQSRQVPRVRQQRRMPAALGLDRVAGVKSDPRQLGMGARVRRGGGDHMPAGRLGFRMAALQPQRTDEAKARLQMVRGQRQHALPMAQREVGPTAPLGQTAPAQAQLQCVVAGIDRCRQRPIG